MAKAALRRQENVAGDFFVDSSCIDCDTCRWMNPETFGRKNGMSYVHTQPKTEEELRSSYHALLACPTQSIGSGKVKKPDGVIQDFPLLVDGAVYHLGFHSEKSYGGAAYLIVHPEGNVMVDSPRYSKPLAEQIEKLGGIKDIFFTHGDDVADHQKFHDHFGCDRWIHRGDVFGEIAEFEHIFESTEQKIRPDIEIMTTPGHTDGSCCLLYKNYLFTGDHLAWSIRLGHLYAFYGYYKDWIQLTESMESLKAKTFNWVLPGHARRFYGDDDQIQKELDLCLAWMREQKP